MHVQDHANSSTHVTCVCCIPSGCVRYWAHTGSHKWQGPSSLTQNTETLPYQFLSISSFIFNTLKIDASYQCSWLGLGGNINQKCSLTVMSMELIHFSVGWHRLSLKFFAFIYLFVCVHMAQHMEARGSLLGVSSLFPSLLVVGIELRLPGLIDSQHPLPVEPPCWPSKLRLIARLNVSEPATYDLHTKSQRWREVINLILEEWPVIWDFPIKYQTSVLWKDNHNISWAYWCVCKRIVHHALSKAPNGREPLTGNEQILLSARGHCNQPRHGAKLSLRHHVNV